MYIGNSYFVHKAIMMVLRVYLIVLSCLTVVLCTEHKDFQTNITSPKDMYVVRATVYQVGILTNQTNETSDSNTGHQEAITFYHKNGSNIDLNAIHDPLLTNVTAEKMVGVAPIINNTVPWAALRQLVSGKSNPPINEHTNVEKMKRDVSERPVEIIKGAAVIPSEAGVQSIALPPLVTLNKNLSKIPVPIPNMSVVSYAKVNTVFHST
ncbi:uncharacterized protein LOC125076175 [Vanessa atalanta]|uniref:uncharacterized protein LOC125076175 n=1 Tax=Vanessa atalanta TaxID=42275 RepID=UPI001FCDEAF6|nr:uncharacterized protein LOC125076175 [Vanessa atalanta]